MNQFIRITLILLIIAITSFCGLNSAIAASSDIPIREKISDDVMRIELKGGVKIDDERQTITLNLRESNLRQVLRMLADKAGMNIIMDENSIKENDVITLDLVEVKLNKAFEYIMTMKKLTYWQDGNTIIIAGNDAAIDLSLNASEIRAIKIKYIDAQRIAAFLNTNIFNEVNRPNTSGSSIVKANPSTNEILIFGNKEDIKLAEEVIEYLDIKPQIKNYTVNYADPIVIASKICWMVFKSDEGEKNSSKADLEEGSESSIVCGNTTESAEGGEAEDFKTPSYWVLADTGINQITIYGGTSEQLNMANEIITNFDKREPQIYIEVSIIELSESGSKALSNSFNLYSSTENISFSDGTSILNNFEIFGGSQTHSINNPRLVSTINMLIEEQKGRVIANPRIIAANNSKSEVNISSDNISKTTTTVDADTNQTTVDYTISADEGINFSIIPKISPNGYVTLTLEPTFNSIKQQIRNADNEIIATLLNKRELKTKSVRIKDGETLVIGGLIQEKESIAHKKFPILGDLPVIGVLFQNQSTVKSRSELILMITPRVIKDADEIVESI